MHEGAGKAVGSEEGASSAESAGRIQERPLSATGPKAAATKWGESHWQQRFQVN